MKYLTVDFGSTYTKLTAIDTEKGDVVGTAAAFTTIETDVMEGFNNGMQQLEAQIGHFAYDRLLCCSSAAGGLKMVALGLVPELTAKAAKMAASSAGAKVVKTYSFEISQAEQQEIYDINPDLVLLCGGTDGGKQRRHSCQCQTAVRHRPRLLHYCSRQQDCFLRARRNIQGIEQKEMCHYRKRNATVQRHQHQPCKAED